MEFNLLGLFILLVVISIVGVILEHFFNLKFFTQLASLLDNDGVGDKEDLDQEWRYSKLPSLLTPAELSFKHTLKLALSERNEIDSKVRLADLISVDKSLSGSDWHKSFNRIKSKHIDFVLSDKKTSELVCAIELDDSSHSRKERISRDEFLNKALKSAELPLVRFKASVSYSTKEIIDAVYGAVERNREIIHQNNTEDDIIVRHEPSIDIPETKHHAEWKCPDCNGELVERKAQKGRYSGVKFLGCSNFPKCHYRKVIGDDV